MRNEHIGGGVIVRPSKIRNYDYTVSGVYKQDLSLPDKYTIPEKNIPDVHDQTWTMMCVAYAMCECAEAHDKKVGNEQRHYAPSWNYGRNESRNDYNGEGLVSENAAKGSLKIGFVDKAYFDFEKDVPEILKLASERDDLLPLSKPNAPKIYYDISYAMVDKKWDVLRKTLVDTQLPVVIISNKFFKGGSHAVIAIGYTDTYNNNKGRYVYFQNSWGADYKENGRFYIPIEQIDRAYVLSWEEPKFPFADVQKGDWFYKGVRTAYLSGYVNGVSDTRFCPYENMIRGDIAVILSRMMDKLEYSVNSFIKFKKQEGFSANEIKFASAVPKFKFMDITDGDYYEDAVYRVFANGFMKGKENNLFDPMASTTRSEMAALLVRVYETVIDKLNTSFSKNISPPCIKCDGFKDVSKDDWFYSSVNAAAKYGLMNGESIDIFEPNRNITRAEGAVTMCRLFKKIEELFDMI